MIRNIYILWFQGFENAPDIVKRCIDSWKYYNPTWNIQIICNDNLIKYLNIEDYIQINKLTINNTALSDVIRIILLKLYGGLWVDATTFCNKPLDDWLNEYISEGFFAFDKPGPDRLISSWFLYSDIDNYIINSWFDLTIKYYKINNTPHTYFWFHYLFGQLYNSDIKFKKIWNSVKKIPANNLGPHYLQEKGLFKKINDKIKLDIEIR